MGELTKSLLYFGKERVYIYSGKERVDVCFGKERVYIYSGKERVDVCDGNEANCQTCDLLVLGGPLLTDV